MLSGRSKYNKMMVYWKDKYKKDYKYDIKELETHIPSLKTANYENVVSYINYMNDKKDIFYNFYNQSPIRRWSWKLKIRKYQTLDEICKNICETGERLGLSKRFELRQKNPNYNHQGKKEIKIGFGNGSFSPSSKGRPSGPKKSLFNRLQLHAKVVEYISEYNTSQYCNICEHKLQKVIKKESGHSYGGILRCPTCIKFLNRDENAAFNIARICKNNGKNKLEDKTPEKWKNYYVDGKFDEQYKSKNLCAKVMIEKS